MPGDLPEEVWSTELWLGANWARPAWNVTARARIYVSASTRMFVCAWASWFMMIVIPQVMDDHISGRRFFFPKVSLCIYIVQCAINSVLQVCNEYTQINEAEEWFLTRVSIYMYHLEGLSITHGIKMIQYLLTKCHVIILKLFLDMLFLGGLYNFALILLFCYKYHEK